MQLMIACPICWAQRLCTPLDSFTACTEQQTIGWSYGQKSSPVMGIPFRFQRESPSFLTFSPSSLPLLVQNLPLFQRMFIIHENKHFHGKMEDIKACETILQQRTLETELENRGIIVKFHGHIILCIIIICNF